MKRLISISALCATAAIAALAQSNETMDRILASDALDYGKAAYLVLVASNNIAEDAGESRSFAMIQQLGWVRNQVDEMAAVSLAEYAYFVMRAFGIKGGLMFTLAPGPRYAYRELLSRGIIQGRSDPEDRISGQRAFRILGRVLDIEGDVP